MRWTAWGVVIFFSACGDDSASPPDARADAAVDAAVDAPTDAMQQADGALSQAALVVQMVWDRDRTDLDLHLLDPTGSAGPLTSSGWFNLQHDCHYIVRNPDWGVVGATNDNPSLDIDDSTGFGPEQISIPSPQSGVFTVGVHYYCDLGLGPSVATVRIFCNGSLARELTQSLAATGTLWQVATIDWPSCAVTPSGQTVTVTQGCVATDGGVP